MNGAEPDAFWSLGQDDLYKRLRATSAGIPIVLILLAAAGLAFFLGDAVDAGIVLAIVAVSAALGVWQERGAAPRPVVLLLIGAIVALYVAMAELLKRRFYAAAGRPPRPARAALVA